MKFIRRVNYMDDFLVLNRHNTMVYFDENKSIIKTYHKEVSIETSKEQYELLIDILNTTKREIKINDFLKEYEDTKYVMKLIKVLYDSGSIFIYPASYQLSTYFKKSWFRVLSQYLPPTKDILHCSFLIDRAVIHITPLVEQMLPGIRGILGENDLHVYQQQRAGKFTENDWVLSTDEDDFLQNAVKLSLSTDRLTGVISTDKRIDKNILPKSNVIDNESLLYKVGPYYTMLYIMKSIVGISKTSFIINKEGKYYEYDLVKEDYMQTIDDYSFPTPTISNGSLDYIGHFESFINTNPNIPFTVSGWKDDNYAELFQMGFATYSFTNVLTKEPFVFAGLDYIDTAMSSIKNGLSYYFNREAKQAVWLVTTEESYYLDKLLLLLEYTEEPYAIYKLEHSHYLNERFAEYLNKANLDLEFFVMKYLHSNSYTVYLYDRENDQLYTDGKKTILIDDKMMELAINYMLVKLNPEKKILTILVTVEDKEEFFLNVNHEFLFFEETNERDFIEKGLTLIKQASLSPTERAWKYEKKLNESNLIVREIEVRAYEEVIV